jgi:arylsulfatase
MSKENIILIIADQWRGDCLSVAGHSGVDTPNLDSLANQGTIFNHAYSSCPSCIAARASLFTGLSPNSHGRIGYKDGIEWNYENMLAQVLGNAGYQTHCSGKTHFFPQRKHCGFQSHDSYEASQNFDGKYVNDYREWLRDQTGGTFNEWDHGMGDNSWIARPSQLPEHLHNNWWTMNTSIDFLKRRDKTRPYFLNISFHRPHPPLDPPQAFYDMYKDRDIPDIPVGKWAEKYNVPVMGTATPFGHLPEHVLKHSRRAYYAQLAHIDNQIGRLLTSLRNLDEEKPHIIFTSDHGELLGDHNLFCKSLPYEGSSRIPLIKFDPSCPAVKDNPFNDIPTVIEDVYPMILDIAGIDIPNKIDGINPLSDSAEKNSYVHSEHSWHIDQSWQMLTDGCEKYIWWAKSGEEQFFDLQNDPEEMNDLGQDPAFADRLKYWRQILIAKLAKRPEDGLSDGTKLIPGKALPPVKSWLLK